MLQLQSALIADAITALGHGLRLTLESNVETFRNYFRRGEPYNDVRCQGQGHTSKPWIHGSIVSKFLRQVTKISDFSSSLV